MIQKAWHSRYMYITILNYNYLSESPWCILFWSEKCRVYRRPCFTACTSYSSQDTLETVVWNLIDYNLLYNMSACINYYAIVILTGKYFERGRIKYIVSVQMFGRHIRISIQKCNPQPSLWILYRLGLWKHWSPPLNY